MMTCDRLLQRHRGGGANSRQSALLQEPGADSARPPTPAGVVVAANVLATCMIVRFLKLTNPSAHAHNAAAAPTYFNAETASPSSAHHQFAVRSSEKNAGTVLMNG